MQENVPEGHVPDATAGPERVYALPEVHYPEELNCAVELVDSHVEAGRGDNVAIRFEDDAITYRELAERTDRVGNGLRAHGVAPGDRVLVRFPNRPEAVVTCLALQKIGAIALPSMKLLRAAELEYILDNAGVEHAVVYDDLLDELAEAADRVAATDTIVVAEDGNQAAGDRPTYAALRDHDADLSPHDTSRDDLALMLYTSGTTGRPKGAIHTHREILASADSYARYCLEPTEADVFGGNPPLPFAYGYGDLVTFPFRFGATTSLVEDASPGDLLDAIEAHGITVLCSVPTAFKQMLNEYPDGPETHDVSSLRVGMSAGEPLAPATFESFKAEYGIDLLDGIGTTEMLHIFISHRHDEAVDPEATGFPVPGYECRIVDPESGADLDRGEAGLLAVRGPTGITYWDRPDKQAEAVVDGWSYPGDIFIQREDGRFVYQSRRDDLIISSGYNIPGPQVEQVLEDKDAVGEVAVVGSPDPDRGEIVKAFVVLAPGYSPDDALVAELQDHVKNTLAPYKYPREVAFLEELPRTETGKIQRVKLREREHDGEGAAEADAVQD